MYITKFCLLLIAIMQMKRYPRNWCVEMGKEGSFGRVRVQLKKADGSPLNPEVPNSELTVAIYVTFKITLSHSFANPFLQDYSKAEIVIHPVSCGVWRVQSKTVKVPTCNILSLNKETKVGMLGASSPELPDETSTATHMFGSMPEGLLLYV